LDEDFHRFCRVSHPQDELTICFLTLWLVNPIQDDRRQQLVTLNFLREFADLADGHGSHLLFGWLKISRSNPSALTGFPLVQGDLAKVERP
jgi:hypothetical protein